DLGHRFHLLLNGRPMLGNVARTMSANGARHVGTMISDELNVVPGIEPFRDVMELVPQVMKARLMHILGLVRDGGCAGAAGDETPWQKQQNDGDRMMGMGLCPRC